MRIGDLAQLENLKLLTGPETLDRSVTGILASNTMSELVARATADTLIVTSLNCAQLARVAELMEASAVCVAGRGGPCPELLAGARASGTAVLWSPRGLEETAAAIEARLAGARGA